MTRALFSSLAVRRALAAAAVVPLGLAGLSACGSDSSEASENPSSSSAGTTTAPEDGSTVAVSDFVELMSASVEDATTAHMTLDITGGASAVTGEGDADYTVTPPAISLTMTMAAMGGQPVEMLMVDGAMYMKSSMTGPKYLKLDLQGETNPLGSSFSDQLDPRAMLDQMEESIESVTYVGESDVDGEPGRQYRVTLDSAAVAEGLGPDVQDLPETLTYDMWFDEDGHYRRMDVDLGPSGGTMSMTFSDWGAPVSITAPPASEVTTMPGSG